MSVETFCNETVESRDLVIGVVESNTLGQGSKPAELEAAWRNMRTKLQKKEKENTVIQNLQGPRK